MTMRSPRGLDAVAAPPLPRPSARALHAGSIHLAVSAGGSCRSRRRQVVTMLASGPPVHGVPPLGDLVSHIVRVGAGEEVRRVHAWWVVAGVAENGGAKRLPGQVLEYDSVRAGRDEPGAGQVECPVATFAGPVPLPAAAFGDGPSDPAEGRLDADVMPGSRIAVQSKVLVVAVAEAATACASQAVVDGTEGRRDSLRHNGYLTPPVWHGQR
jgi:hypothetical protein